MTHNTVTGKKSTQILDASSKISCFSAHPSLPGLPCNWEARALQIDCMSLVLCLAMASAGAQPIVVSTLTASFARVSRDSRAIVENLHKSPIDSKE